MLKTPAPTMDQGGNESTSHALHPSHLVTDTSSTDRADSAPDEVGELTSFEVDPAEIRREALVGVGNTAQVFKGTFRSRTVAIKQVDTTNNWQQVFGREMQVLQRVHHANLVEFIGAVTLQLPISIITEFCEGGTMCNLLHCSDVDLYMHQQLKMAMDVALALDYLHTFNPPIIHRDLKSLNLLLMHPVLSGDDIPHVKVSDFGLARLKSAGSSWGNMTRFAGTCHWMAPEVAVGTTYGEKADVFSYAMVLFEIMCREIPFEEEEPEAIAKLFSKGVRPGLESVPADCPPAVVAVMQGCWRHEACDRPSFSRIVDLLRQ